MWGVTHMGGYRHLLSILSGECRTLSRSMHPAINGLRHSEPTVEWAAQRRSRYLFEICAEILKKICRKAIYRSLFISLVGRPSLLMNFLLFVIVFCIPRPTQCRTVAVIKYQVPSGDQQVAARPSEPPTNGGLSQALS